MSKLPAALLAAALCAAGGDSLNDMFINAAAAVKHSVVSISVFNRRGEGAASRHIKAAYGSGTVIEDGFIVTNYHVVSKGGHYEVLFNGEGRLELEPIGDGRYYLADPKTDIAILKIRKHKRYPIAPIRFEDSARISEGEWVLAAGNPYGLHRTITTGIVSSKGRDDIGFADIEDFIQTDVPINPGNSGGPLVNLRGRLIGINTAIRSESGGFQGISFAIPSNLVRLVCGELIRHGRVRRGWIGFMVKERRMGPGGEECRLDVISVIRHSPAEAAGLRTGDTIREVDGEKVHTLGGLIRAVANKPVGSRIDINVSRDGRLERVRLVLRERTVYRSIRKGMHRLFSRYGIEIDENAETGDVVVSFVSPRSYGLNLKRGDLVRSVNGKNVSTLDAFIKAFMRDRERIDMMAVERDSRILEIRVEE